MAESAPRRSRRRTRAQKDGFGGLVEGAALIRHQAAWRRVDETGDISHLWKMGVYQKPDDDT